MSEQHQAGGTGSHTNFFWDIQPWVISNSDNSGASTDEKLNGKTSVIHSTSTTPTPTPTSTPPPAVLKRGRNGGLPKAAGKTAGGGGSGTSSTRTDGGAESDDHGIHIWTERERRKKMRNMFSSLHALLPHLPPKADKSTTVDEAVNYIKKLQNSLQELQKQKLEMLRGTSTTASIDYDQQQQTSVIVASSTISGFNSREAFLADQTSAPPTPRISSNTMMLSPNMQDAPCNNINPSAVASLQTWSSPNVVLCVNGQDAQISVCSPRKPGLFSTVCYVLEKHKLDVVSAHVSSDFYRSMYMIHAHATGAACEQFQKQLAVEEIYKLAVGEINFWLSSS